MAQPGLAAHVPSSAIGLWNVTVICPIAFPVLSFSTQRMTFELPESVTQVLKSRMNVKRRWVDAWAAVTAPTRNQQLRMTLTNTVLTTDRLMALLLVRGGSASNLGRSTDKSGFGLVSANFRR